MTLEETGRAAVRAAGEGDMEALRVALEARDAAISLLRDAQPSPEVHARLITAFEIGEAILGAIRSFKLRVAIESARLNQIRTYAP
jgi:hypothetical protein